MNYKQDQSEAVEKTVEEKNKLGFEEEIRKKKEEEDGPRKREGDELKKDEADGVVCKDNTELKNIDGGDAKATDNVVDSKMAEEKKGADESSCSAKPEKLTNGDAISIRNEGKLNTTWETIHYFSADQMKFCLKTFQLLLLKFWRTEKSSRRR